MSRRTARDTTAPRVADEVGESLETAAAEQYSLPAGQDVSGGKIDDQRSRDRTEDGVGAHAGNRILGGLAQDISERREVSRGMCADGGQAQDENDLRAGDHVVAGFEDFHGRLRSDPVS